MAILFSLFCRVTLWLEQQLARSSGELKVYVTLEHGRTPCQEDPTSSAPPSAIHFR